MLTKYYFNSFTNTHCHGFTNTNVGSNNNYNNDNENDRKSNGCIPLAPPSKSRTK